MRDYAVLSSTFWTGPTGRKIRDMCQRKPLGHLYRSVATYLFTCRHRNMIGVYYIPLPTMAHEVGCGIHELITVLKHLSRIGFSFYDPETEHVWVPKMAKWQVGEVMKEKDNRKYAVLNLLNKADPNPFLSKFYHLYKDLYDIPPPDELDLWQDLERGYEGAIEGSERGMFFDPSSTVTVPATASVTATASVRKIEVIQKKGGEDPDGDGWKLAEFLLAEIKKNKEDFRGPETLNNWSREFRLMIERDGRKPRRIAEVIRWVQADNRPRGNGRGFCWAPNILSAGKLREKFDQVEMQMKSGEVNLGERLKGSGMERWLTKHRKEDGDAR
jgi:hypothetical protein